MNIVFLLHWVRVVTFEKNKNNHFKAQKDLSSDSNPHKVGFLGQVVFSLNNEQCLDHIYDFKTYQVIVRRMQSIRS